jgi:hypothetical protein
LLRAEKSRGVADAKECDDDEEDEFPKANRSMRQRRSLLERRRLFEFAKDERSEKARSIGDCVDSRRVEFVEKHTQVKLLNVTPVAEALR